MCPVLVKLDTLGTVCGHLTVIHWSHLLEQQLQERTSQKGFGVVLNLAKQKDIVGETC